MGRGDGRRACGEQRAVRGFREGMEYWRADEELPQGDSSGARVK